MPAPPRPHAPSSAGARRRQAPRQTSSTGATRPTSGSCAAWASATSACPSPGRACCRRAPGRSTRPAWPSTWAWWRRCRRRASSRTSRCACPGLARRAAAPRHKPAAWLAALLRRAAGRGAGASGPGGRAACGRWGHGDVARAPGPRDAGGRRPSAAPQVPLGPAAGAAGQLRRLEQQPHRGRLCRIRGDGVCGSRAARHVLDHLQRCAAQPRRSQGVALEQLQPWPRCIECSKKEKDNHRPLRSCRAVR